MDAQSLYMDRPQVRKRAPAAARERWPAAADLGTLFLVNLALVVGLWWRDGGAASLSLTSLGRLTGLVGTYLVLVQLLLVARIPPLERRVGLDRLTHWHNRNGKIALSLLVAHALFIVLGYASRAGAGPLSEELTLVRTVPGMLTATVGLALLIAVVVLSVRIARRRLRYETWYFVHLYTYLALALSFSHQLSSGQAFVGDQVARGYWIVLWVGTLATLLLFRVGAPLLAFARHDMRVERVRREGPGVISVWITGRRLDLLGAQPGQFFLWRFLTSGRWHEAHPFSLSAAPDGRTLRITVKALGDYTARLARLAPGTRVLAEGPYGAFTDARRTVDRVVYIAGGIGITPIRALLETAPPGAMLLYRAIGPRDLVLRKEIEAVARGRGVEVHYLLGDHRDPRARHLLTPRHLRGLVPDLRVRDVFLCGPPAMVDATERALHAAGVPGRRIHVERFAL